MNKHIQTTVGSRFPGYDTISIGAFMFLRFFNTAIAVPESYGLLQRARTLVLFYNTFKALREMSLDGNLRLYQKCCRTFLGRFNLVPRRAS